MHDTAFLPQRASRLAVLAIVLLALVVRLGWGLSRPTDAASIERLPDQREYLALARSLLDGRGLAMAEPRFNDVVYAFRMPGYPLLAAACGGEVKAIRVVQALLDASTVLAVIWLARRWLSPRRAYIAGLIVALDPIHVYFSALILSETLFAAMLAWAMACLAHGASPLARGSRFGKGVWLLGAGLLIVSIYVRSSALPFPVAIAALAIIAESRSPSFRPGPRVPVLTLVALATFLALLPWAIRNQAVLGRWTFTTTNDGFTLYDGLNPDADGSSDQSTLAHLPLLPNLSEPQRSDYLRLRAIAFVRAEPWRAIAMIPTKVGRTWSPVPLSAEFGSKRLYVVGAAAHAVPLFICALVGLFNPRLPRAARLYLLGPAVLITVMHAATVGSLRYRMPAHATLAVLAAGAFARRGRSLADASATDRL